jgi:hypothetical protein
VSTTTDYRLHHLVIRHAPDQQPRRQLLHVEVHLADGQPITLTCKMHEIRTFTAMRWRVLGEFGRRLTWDCPSRPHEMRNAWIDVLYDGLVRAETATEGKS